MTILSMGRKHNHPNNQNQRWNGHQLCHNDVVPGLESLLLYCTADTKNECNPLCKPTWSLTAQPRPFAHHPGGGLRNHGIFLEFVGNYVFSYHIRIGY